MKRIVNTDNQELDLAREYNSRSDGFKPNGLWYAIDNDWIEWCESEMPHWIKPNLIELEINPEHLLIIETIRELSFLISKYSIKITTYSNGIDWQKLAANYSGIEIRNYQDLKWNNQQSSFNDIWLWGWDCSSGCIWDLSIIKSYRYSQIEKKETA